MLPFLHCYQQTIAYMLCSNVLIIRVFLTPHIGVTP